MMNKSSEILALINLIDDPDEEIFNSVANKFVDLGEEIIPILQEQLDFTSDLSIIYKIEDILYKISFTILSNRLTKWHASTNSTLLEGSIIISNFI